MLVHKLRIPNRHEISRLLWQAALIAMVIMLSLIIGLASAVLPYWFFFAILFIPTFLVLAWKWPELGIVGVMALLSGVAPYWLVPQVPIAGGQLQGSELAFFALLAIIAVQSAFRTSSWTQGLKPYVWPIGLLLFLAVVSSISAFYFFENDLKAILYEARIFIYWMIVPAVVMVIDSKQKLDRFLIALLCLGVVLATMVSIQSFTGTTLLSVRSATGDLSTANKIYSDVVRSSLAQGVYVILFSLFLLTARYLLKVAKPLTYAPLIIILTAGVLATFGRGVWVASVMSALLLGLLVGQKGILKILFGGIALVLVAAVVLSVSRPQMLSALRDRVLSIDTHVAQKDESLVWRETEREYAYKKILEYPVFGIGLGGEYQPIRNQRMKPEQTQYIHNSYLYLALKLGLVAIVIPFWVSWLVYANGRRLMQNIKEARHRATVAAVVPAFMLPNITSFTQPEWMDHPGVAFMGIMIGLMGVLNNLYSEDKLNDI